MNQATRVMSGLLALVFLGIAVYFGVNGSWLNAILFFLVFGGLEFAVWFYGDPQDDAKRHRKS